MDKFSLTPYDEEDDLYSGFNEFHPTLNTSSLIQDSLSRDVKNQQQSLLQVQYEILRVLGAVTYNFHEKQLESCFPLLILSLIMI